MFNTGGIVMSKYRILVKGIVKKDNKFLIVEGGMMIILRHHTSGSLLTGKRSSVNPQIML